MPFVLFKIKTPLQRQDVKLSETLSTFDSSDLLLSNTNNMRTNERFENAQNIVRNDVSVFFLLFLRLN